MKIGDVILLLLTAGFLILALLSIRQAKRYFSAGKRAKGFLAGIAGASMLALVAFVWCLPMVAHCHALSPRTQCQSNLHQLDLALQAYCYPPVDTYPTNLAELSGVDLAKIFERSPPEYVSPKTFVCAASKNPPGKMSNVMEWTDYIYVSGAGPAAPAEMPVLICPPMFHYGLGWNALMGDHSCTWYLCSYYKDPAYLDKLIEDPLAFCSNAPASLRSNIYVHVSKRITEQSKGKYRSHGLK